MTQPHPAVSLKNVLFCWPRQQTPLLNIPSFTAHSGEHVFISGPSGSGKSTLLGLIAGILLPTSGSVSVNGICLNELSGAERDKFRGNHIGFIFQQFNLIPYLSILDNVLIPCRFSPLRHQRASARAGNPTAEAKTLLERLDLSPALWNRPASKLSVGQQQRVAAARALIGNPAILIADEPTSSLDADRRKIFLRLLLEECRAAGTLLLFVSHEHSLAEDFSTVMPLSKINSATEGAAS
ncbi:MAG: ABC transporter ATP-binding protein [Azoarcus sp.]|nr:ABC transporter ATP-binding protein [Azoarcus sp.]